MELDGTYSNHTKCNNNKHRKYSLHNGEEETMKFSTICCRHDVELSSSPLLWRIRLVSRCHPNSIEPNEAGTDHALAANSYERRKTLLMLFTLFNGAPTLNIDQQI
jgi:hypothetical protein